MKKILVIQQKRIGDVLVSSIICNNLKTAYPSAQVDYLVYESTSDVLQGNSSIDNIILFRPKHRKSKVEFFRLIQNLKKTNYDIIIDSYSKLESWIIMFFIKASMKISYRKVGRTFLYTHNINYLKTPKTNFGLIIDRRLSLLEPLNISTIDPVPKLFVEESENNFAIKLFEKYRLDQNRKTIMISIIGSSENKTLPLSEMSKTVDFVADNSDVNILFNYFPKQLKEAKQVFNACKVTTQKHIYFDLFGNSLREFIAIMNQCDMIIGNDGGTTNMAKALNKASFIIFSPWIEKIMWSIFEDGKFHKAVHLKDYRYDLFEGKSEKKLKKISLDLYKEFKISHFSKELKLFLEYNLYD